MTYEREGHARDLEEELLEECASKKVSDRQRERAKDSWRGVIERVRG